MNAKFDSIIAIQAEVDAAMKLCREATAPEDKRRHARSMVDAKQRRADATNALSMRELIAYTDYIKAA